ncbi:hypothetical protein ACFWXK_20470 [Streptomyces sp. NPDC059070]|uniref:hypothetical protein n=1 Tax=Streptomyces sp. NPDC059070 TaxID=3346713 RepID=UPI003696CE27
MTTSRKPSSQDAVLEQVFGAPVEELYARAVRPDTSPALVRALELRAFLAIAEEQVVHVRERIHVAMAPGVGFDRLDVDVLRFEAQWLEAALTGRAGYVTALSRLLAAMPPPVARPATAPAAVRPALPPAPPTAGTAMVGRGR